MARLLLIILVLCASEITVVLAASAAKVAKFAHVIGCADDKHGHKVTDLSNREIERIQKHGGCLHLTGVYGLKSAGVYGLKSGSYIWINGEITETTTQFVKNAISFFRSYMPQSRQTGPLVLLDVRLNSTGGSIDEAIEIGNILWKEQLLAVVPQDAVCYSACVLVYAGSAYRFPLGEIGIHRPVFMDDDVDSETNFEERYGPVFQKVTKYLSQFGVSPEVVNMMRSIPSTSMRVLSEQELVDFGLSKNVLSAEQNRQKFRKRCGTEYEQRYNESSNLAWNLIEERCAASDIDCMTRIQKDFGVDALSWATCGKAQ